MANKVMRMSEPSHQTTTQTGALLQKKCAACEHEEKIQKKPLAETIQRVSNSTSEVSTAPSHVESVINSSRGGGSTMDNGTKNFMESRFGTDFSDVKIHTGIEAVQMSRELNAQAFTVGNDIYFNEGKYSPNSDSGKHLLAHELTHTVQQSGGVNKKIQRECLNTEPTSTDTRYITGTGDSRREYVYTDSAGAESFIRSHAGLNLVCFRMQRESGTVYVIYQSRTTSPTESPSASEATDPCSFSTRNIKNREVHLNLNLNALKVYERSGVNFSLAFEQYNLITGPSTMSLLDANHRGCHLFSVKGHQRLSSHGLINFVNYCDDFGFHSNYWRHGNPIPTTPTLIPGNQSAGCARIPDTDSASTASKSF